MRTFGCALGALDDYGRELPRAIMLASWRSPLALAARHASRRLSTSSKITSPPMVYIKGEEMTSYCMEVRRDRNNTPCLYQPRASPHTLFSVRS